MKKIAVFSILFATTVSLLFSHDNSLYDVNYDAPRRAIDYDGSLDVFQKIYLQYEDAITTAGNIIRKEERDSYLRELENFKTAERLRTDTTIENMRKMIYGNEVESVRQKETERLTIELTEKISAELNQELTAKYEKIKNDEIAELYADLKKKAYDETEATTQRVKSISSASAQVIIILLALAIIIIAVQRIIDQRKRKKLEKNQFDDLVELYMSQLKAYNGDAYQIRSQIEKNNKLDSKEKDIRNKAVSEAENRYSGDLKEVQEYSEIFDSYILTLRNYFKAWKEDNYPQISVYFKDYYGKYKKTTQELYNSIEFRKEADKKNGKNLLNTISNELKDLSNEINERNVLKEFSEEKKQLSKNFSDLAKCVKKGEF